MPCPPGATRLQKFVRAQNIVPLAMAPTALPLEERRSMRLLPAAERVDDWRLGGAYGDVASICISLVMLEELRKKERTRYLFTYNAQMLERTFDENVSALALPLPDLQQRTFLSRRLMRTLRHIYLACIQHPTCHPTRSIAPLTRTLL